VVGGRDRPNGVVEDRGSLERLDGLAHVRQKAEEEEWCSAASYQGREEKEGKWGLARAHR
jgi:hypothetical protein